MTVVVSTGRGSSTSESYSPSSPALGKQLEVHLEERVVALAAVRPELAHEPLEGQLLVGERVHGGRAHPSEQLAERRIAREVRAQHERVHEEADQALDLDAAAIGDGRADHDVVLAGVAVQKRLERRERRHEQGRALAPAELHQRAVERGRDLEIVVGSVERRLSRPRPVSRQLQRLRVRELRRPVVEGRLSRRSGEPLALPLDEVRVVDGEVLERGRPACRVRLVQRKQLALEHLERPVVAHDVMHREQQGVLVVIEAEQAGPQQRPAREVERRRRFRIRDPRRLLLAGGFVEPAQVRDRQRHVELGEDDLLRLPVDVPERRPEDLVAAHDLVDAAGERVDVERHGEAETDVQVVERATGRELIEEPEAALSV